MKTTLINIAPPILQNFNPYLLMNYFQTMKMVLEKEIIPLYQKKVKSRHVGKKKEFEKLYKEFLEIYERKEIEEINYQAEIKEKIKKRSSFSFTGTTIRFKRMDTSE